MDLDTIQHRSVFQTLVARVNTTIVSFLQIYRLSLLLVSHFGRNVLTVNPVALLLRTLTTLTHLVFVIFLSPNPHKIHLHDSSCPFCLAKYHLPYLSQFSIHTRTLSFCPQASFYSLSIFAR